MDLERFFRDVALVVTGSNHASGFVDLTAIYGDAARWFEGRNSELRSIMGQDGSAELGAELSLVADVVAASRSQAGLEPTGVYSGFCSAHREPARFASWLQAAQSALPAAVRELVRRAATDSSADDLFLLRVPAIAYQNYADCVPPSVAVQAGTDVTATRRGLIRQAQHENDHVLDVWVSAADCPLAKANRMDREGVEVACRDKVNLAGCAHLRGAGADGMVRCAFARVAQMTGPPKPGDELDVKQRDGTNSKVKVRRVEPDGSAVVDPTWATQPSTSVMR